MYLDPSVDIYCVIFKCIVLEFLEFKGQSAFFVALLKEVSEIERPFASHHDH